MLDDQMKTMLEEANTLTGEDLEFLRSDGSVAVATAPKRTARTRTPQVPQAASGGEKVDDLPSSVSFEPHESAAPTVSGPPSANKRPPRVRKDSDIPHSAVTVASMGPTTPVSAGPAVGNSSRGAYERERTRESKVSTCCLGAEREKHDWWPMGTEVVGQIGSEFFTATVVENTSVKSNRSLVITSGAAKGVVCLTPTRAAIEATEAYRQAHNLGRGGGVTNGWMFWKPRTGATV